MRCLDEKSVWLNDAAEPQETAVTAALADIKQSLGLQRSCTKHPLRVRV